MIEFFHDPADPASQHVADTLASLTVAHTVVVDRDLLPAGGIPPLIRDGDRVVSGTEDLDGYLREIESVLAEWRRFQSDTCYIGDDGCVI